MGILIVYGFVIFLSLSLSPAMCLFNFAKLETIDKMHHHRFNAIQLISIRFPRRRSQHFVVCLFKFQVYTVSLLRVVRHQSAERHGTS